jgi:hypothetical protein
VAKNLFYVRGMAQVSEVSSRCFSQAEIFFAAHVKKYGSEVLEMHVDMSIDMRITS